jgi:hypothetical protein
MCCFFLMAVNLLKAPLLEEIQRVNKLVESEYADPTKLRSVNFTHHLFGKNYIVVSIDQMVMVIPSFLEYGLENKIEELKTVNE